MTVSETTKYHIDSIVKGIEIKGLKLTIFLLIEMVENYVIKRDEESLKKLYEKCLKIKSDL